MLERTSTLSFSKSLNSSNRRLQVALLDAQRQLTTGRYADVGLKIGGQISRNLTWRTEIADLTSTIERNSLVSSRAQVGQATLEAIKTQIGSLRDIAISGRSAQSGQSIAKAAGGNTLNSLLELMNTSFAGDFIFAGRSPDVTPLSSYEGLSAQIAFETAFQQEFGFPKNSPSAANISQTQMQQFLDGRFSALFDEPAWSTDWSNADNGNLYTRVDAGTTLDLDANVNEVPFRQVLKAAVALHEFGGTAIQQGVFQLVADKSAENLAEGFDQIAEIQARIGHGQNTLELATNRLSAKKSLLETAIGKTENVSQYDAAAQVNNLMTQLESSYAVTGRISRLSLLSFL
jgi:flagellar hook-associated protein 3 FlgL